MDADADVDAAAQELVNASLTLMTGRGWGSLLRALEGGTEGTQEAYLVTSAHIVVFSVLSIVEPLNYRLIHGSSSTLMSRDKG